MSDYSNKTNNEIVLEIKQLQYDHEAIKLKMIEDYDLLEVIEKKFNEANKELSKRLGK